MTAISGRSLSRLSGGLCRWVLPAALLLAATAHARAPSSAASGFVSVADGPPFTVIRGDDLRMGTRGVTLLSGDIVETGPEGFLVVQMSSGSRVGIGPASRVYFTERGGSLALLVREGWVKADFRAAAIPGTVLHGTVAAPLLEVQCEQCVVLVHGSADRDEIFDEQGQEVTLVPRSPGESHVEPRMRPGQLATSDSHMDVVVAPRLTQEFLDAMPRAFRDSLPAVTVPPGKPLVPQPLHKVSYGEIEAWLTVEADWRGGFVPRFRGRLKDPAFFSAMDAHLVQLPEWGPVLHPPRRPDGAPTGSKPPRGAALSPSEKPSAGAEPSSDDAPSADDGSTDKAPAGDVPPPGDKPSPGDQPASGDKPPLADKPPPGDLPASGDKPPLADKPPPGDKPSPGDQPASGDKPPPAGKPPPGGLPPQ